jgi:Domain of unknown function (DUF4169)
MSADLINLRRARKSKLRDEAEKQAEQNRAKFGRSKVEKNISKFETSKLQKDLNGKKREI